MPLSHCQRRGLGRMVCLDVGCELLWALKGRSRVAVWGRLWRRKEGRFRGSLGIFSSP